MPIVRLLPLHVALTLALLPASLATAGPVAAAGEANLATPLPGKPAAPLPGKPAAPLPGKATDPPSVKAVAPGAPDSAPASAPQSLGHAALPAPAAQQPRVDRLPRLAIPKRYRIHISPNIEKKSFTGNVVISLYVPRATRTLVLNSLELKVERPQLDGRAAAVQLKQNDQAQTLTLTFKAPILAGQHTLGLTFTGNLTDEPRGLYIQPYQASGQPASMLVTQLEPADARRIFPLWDEPAYRAIFELDVDVPRKFLAISNMPIVSRHALRGGSDRVKFQPTPRMASYLMVLCAGELEAIGRRVAGVDLRVVTTKGKRETGRYALDALAKILPYYNDYFGVRYPLPKLDLIAVPGGVAGAMENWGGIVFQDPTLLFDPRLSSERDKESIFAFVAHETAHQWFGNYVTMAWWDDLWLNEGFANWMETRTTGHFNPTWPTWLGARHQKDAALRADALASTHAVQQPILNATEADSTFDSITYDKGEAVIRMLESAMGERAFRAGIRSYMRAHAYGNAQTTDLWQALGAVTTLPVARIAPHWITTPGFPVVKATLTGGLLGMTQERVSPGTATAAVAPWPIPMVWSNSGSLHTFLFDSPSIRLPLPSPNGLVKLDWGGEGFYRVQYDQRLFERLRSGFSTLPEADRVDLLADTWALGLGGRVPATDALALVDTAKGSSSLPVWSQIVRILTEASDLEEGMPGEALVSAALAKRLAPLVTQLGWTPRAQDTATQLQLRQAVLRLLGGTGAPAVLARAREHFAQFQKDPASLAGAMRNVVLMAVGRHATASEYDTLLQRARAADGFEEKRGFYDALATAQDPLLAKRTLALILNGEIDPPLALGMLGRVGTHHSKLAREFVSANREKLFAKRPPGERVLVVSAAYASATDDASAEAFEAYTRRVVPAEAWPEVRKHAEYIHTRASFARALRPALEAWAKKERP